MQNVWCFSEAYQSVNIRLYILSETRMFPSCHLFGLFSPQILWDDPRIYSTMPVLTRPMHHGSLLCDFLFLSVSNAAFVITSIRITFFTIFSLTSRSFTA